MHPLWSPEMSVFSLTEDLKAILGNWSWSGEIVSTSGARMPLGGINKTVSNYDQTVLTIETGDKKSKAMISAKIPQPF